MSVEVISSAEAIYEYT